MPWKRHRHRSWTSGVPLNKVGAPLLVIVKPRLFNQNSPFLSESKLVTIYRINQDSVYR